MPGFWWLLHCIFTTKPDAYGFTGLFLGVLVGAILAFRVPIDITRSAYINATIGAAFAVVFGMLGILLGEILRVLWTGVCELP